MPISVFGGVRIARPLSRPPAPRCLIAACGLLFACGEPSANADVQPYTWSRDTIVAQPEFLRDLADTARRGGLIGRPRFVRATGGLTFVSDASEDRVAVLDSLANVVRWIGSRGRGPGELFGVGHLETRDGRLFVAEALNGRVSEFTLEGKFVHTLSSPFAAGSLGATSRQTLAIARSATHYALRLDARGGGSNALRRPPLSARDRQSRWSVLFGHDLLAADSTRWWVLDQGSGNVCVYGEPRATAQCRSLPTDLRARLGEYRDRRVAMLEAAISQRVSAAPLVKDMTRTGRWLALLLPLPELPLVLLDVNDGTLTPVLLRSHPAPPWARTATSVAWDGHGFIVVGDEGIGRLRPIRPTFHQHLTMRLFTAFLATSSAVALAATVSGTVSRPGTAATAAYACRVDPSGNTSGPSADICDQVVRRWKLLTGTTPNPGEIRLITTGVPQSSDGGGQWTLEWLAQDAAGGPAHRRKSDGLSAHYAQNILPHEAGHRVFSSHIGVPASQSDQYGSGAPDWIDEAAAVWMESRSARADRVRAVVGTKPSLSKLVLMAHPIAPLMQPSPQEPDAPVIERTVTPPCPRCTKLPEEMRTKYRIIVTTIGPDGKTKTAISYSATDPDAAATAEQRGFYPLAYSLLRFIRVRGGVAAVRELFGRFRENPKPRIEVLLGLPGLPPTAASFEAEWHQFLRNPPAEDP